jgi:cytochrome c oxidase subunit 2
LNRGRILAIAAISIALIAVGVYVAVAVDVSGILPRPGAQRAELVDQLFRVMLGVSAVIFLIVEGGLVYAVLRFRRQPGDQEDGPPIHGNTALEIVWTLIPVVIVVSISLYSYQVLTKSELPGENPLVIEVVGRQFSWQFTYPDAGVTAAVLHLPLNREAHLQITSEDVIHSFYVPQFRVKRDATPGRVSDLTLRPVRTGTYQVQCAELCGPGHASMVTDAIVETPEEFESWLSSQQAAAELPLDSVEGQRGLFLAQGCGACHTLTDAGAEGQVGPDLDGVGQRAGERLPGLDAQAYIRQSILDPNAYVVEGFPEGVMPQNFGEKLSNDEINALVQFLLKQ